MSETWNDSVEEHGQDDDQDDEESKEKSDKDRAYASITCSSQLWDDDIIDISGLDMEDEETWLLQANTSELSFDLRTWLKRDFHKDTIKLNNITIDNNEVEIVSPIDTRTFTRSKKKMAKMNIDSIRERALPAVMYNDNGELSSSSSWNTKIKINWKEEETRNEDCIPPMLRQSLSGIVPAGVNAQESLEAFLNMSQSKGIDSFINMAEPEFNESLMNISRSSFLHTMHSNVGITNIGMADSQILTESMMHTSMFNDVEDNFTNDFDNNSSINRFNIHSVTMDRNWLDSSTVTITPSDETFTTTQCQGTISNIDKQQESFIVNKTFDSLLPSDSTNLSDTITVVEDCSKRFNTMEAKNSNETFDSNTLFSKKKSLNSTFKAHEIDECENENIMEQHNEISSNSTYVTNDEINFPFTQNATEEKPINWPNNELPALQNNEPSKSLDMTYSKRDFMMLNESADIIKLSSSSSTTTTKDEIDKGKNDDIVGPKLSTDLPVNRYQTYRKPALVNKLANPIGKMSLNYSKNYQGKSMESLSKVSSSTLDSQAIYGKLNGPNGSLSRLPQTLQKSNPNLRSHRPTIARGQTMKTIQQSKFGFQSVGRATVKNGQPTLSNRLNTLAQVQGGSDKLETRNSSESIESTLSTCSGPDFDDGLSTCSDGGRHRNCEETSINSKQLNKIVRMQEEKLNPESTPKSDRKILENTWITSEKDLPSPILKSNEIIATQISCSNNVDSEIQTSSPLLSPAESLQSLPLNSQNHTTDEGKTSGQQKSLPLNKLANLESKTDGVRLPISRSSNLPSGIPRPASRIPAPRFSRTNAQVKSQNSLKKSLF